jgi:hypothetical protein
LLVTPHPLPRMDFSKEFRRDRARGGNPTFLTSAPDIEDLVEAMVVRFLANRDENLHFGLLTDFPDTSGGNTAGGRTALAARPAENRRAE